MHQVFTEFALILLVSAIAGAIGLRLRQPVIIAYIVVGILVGPRHLVWFRHTLKLICLLRLAFQCCCF